MLATGAAFGGLARHLAGLSFASQAIQPGGCLTRAFLLPWTSAAVDQTRLRHSRKDQRKEWFILRDPPLGPNKKLPPGMRLHGDIGPPGNYKRLIHYPEDGEYTIKPLAITKLGGRDPETGRKVIQGVGGGSKQRYRWIDFRRLPKDWNPEEDYVERVIEVRYDPIRKPMIALTGQGSKLRWQIATENMKPGDLIATNGRLPTTPVKPVEGNGYALGALPIGTKVCLVQQYPFTDVVQVYNERENSTILRKEGDRVVIDRIIAGRKREFSMDQRCQCVVGTVSIHPLKAAEIGTPNRKRWMGMSPRSGFWQRKTGQHGRKNRPMPPVEVVEPPEPPKDRHELMSHPDHGVRGRYKTNRWKQESKTKQSPLVH